MFKSLRWQLQAWHAVVLLVVLTSFGGVVYTLHWQTRMQQVDAELHRTVNAVRSQLWKLVPWPARRPRRTDVAKPENEGGPRVEQAVASGSETSSTDADSSKTDASKPLARPSDQQPKDRQFRGPGPVSAEFVQLFHGEEESRLYFIIWGRDGNVLQKSDGAPTIDYPDFHTSVDDLSNRRTRERRTDHIYREVISCVAFPRPPVDPNDQAPQKPFDYNVLVGRSLEKDLAAQHQSGFRLVAIGLVILAAGMLGGGWLTARAIRPITAMTATAEAISAQNLSERINVQDTASELGKLATVLNGSFDRLQAAIERQRQFTADASHELRTPLSVIATHSELALSRPRSNEDYRATIETCQRASMRMKSLIDSLLLLARFDSGATLIKREPVNLELVVRDAVEMLEPLAAERGIRVECQTAPCQVMGDSDRLSQVVTNLMINAIRYNVENGTIRVSAGANAGQAVICVSDTGIGIAQDQLPLIFDRFYQVDKARSRAEGSCGLGLSICKTIVEAHGGTITATSQPGAGTTVEFRLPRVESSGGMTGRSATDELRTTALAEV